MKRLVAALTAIAAVGLIFLVSSTAQSDAPKYTDAATYYKDAKCVVCHGQKAEKKFDDDKKEEELVNTILNGKRAEKPPNMPGYEAKGLTADQAKAMIAYMKSLKQ